MTNIILETERLLLRYQEDDDLDFMVKLWTDNEITKYVGGPRDKIALIKSFNSVAQFPKKEIFDLWYVTLKGSNELIGMAGLLLKEIENEQFHEINYYIEKKHWNNGYAAEIANGIIFYFRKKHKIMKFIAIIDKENLSSVKVSKKIGMKYWKTVTRSSGEKEIYRADFSV